MQPPRDERAITLLTGLGMELADTFKMHFGDRRLTGSAGYVPEMAAPEGLGLAGSKQPLQELKLVPERGPILVIGSVNLIHRRAELRTFEYMDRLHRQRFKMSPFPADPSEYAALLDEVRSFLVVRRYEVSQAEAAAPPPPAQTPVPPPTPSALRSLINKLIGRR